MAVTPGGASWRQLAGVATVAGIGFTVPLFVAGLAFPPGRFDAAVKLACCSPWCSPVPAAVGAAGRRERTARSASLTNSARSRYPSRLVDAGGVCAPMTHPPGRRP
jgi:Na+/H+ antiporter NhaA